jgi:hypothetical protein
MARPDPREDLRSTQEAIAADASKVTELEKAKSGVEPEDPEAVDLSDRVLGVAKDLEGKAAAEAELARRTSSEPGSG